MARARNIKPSFFKNELLGEGDPLLGLLFISLWTLADKAGRLEDRPLRIKAETFPYRENIDINGYLTQLLSLGFIDRYKAVCEGKELAIIEIVNFTKHQTPHSTEKTSELPCKPIDKPITLINESAAVNGHINVLIPDSSNTDSSNTESLLLIPDSSNTDSVRAEKSAPSQKGSQLPKDWQLPKAWGQWALSEKPELDANAVRKIAENFKDHWLANANQRNAKKSDWEAAWRYWVRTTKTAFGATKLDQITKNTDKAISAFVSVHTEKTIEGEVLNA